MPYSAGVSSFILSPSSFRPAPLALLANQLPQLAHGRHEFLDGIDALLEVGLLLCGQLQLDDFLDAAGAQDYRDADIVAADAVLFLTKRGTGNEPLLVANDRF